jgi:hypothetical protein
METLKTIIVTVLVMLAITHFAWKITKGETVIAYLQRIARFIAYPCGIVVAICIPWLILELLILAPFAWICDNFGETTGNFYRDELGHRVSFLIICLWVFGILGLIVAALGGMFAEGGLLYKPLTNENDDNAS